MNNGQPIERCCQARVAKNAKNKQKCPEINKRLDLERKKRPFLFLQKKLPHILWCSTNQQQYNKKTGFNKWSFFSENQFFKLLCWISNTHTTNIKESRIAERPEKLCQTTANAVATSSPVKTKSNYSLARDNGRDKSSWGKNKLSLSFSSQDDERARVDINYSFRTFPRTSIGNLAIYQHIMGWIFLAWGANNPGNPGYSCPIGSINC